MSSNPYGPSADHVDLNKHQPENTAGQTATAAEPVTPQRRRGGNGGFWLVAIGLFMLAGAVGINFPERMWGLFCFIPLAWAIASVYRCYRQTGQIGGNLWWLFGSLFPAAAGLGILFNFDVNYTVVVAAGFIAMGVFTMLGRRGGC